MKSVLRKVMLGPQPKTVTPAGSSQEGTEAATTEVPAPMECKVGVKTHSDRHFDSLPRPILSGML